MILEDSFFLALIPPNSAAIRNVKENKIDDNLLPKPFGIVSIAPKHSRNEKTIKPNQRTNIIILKIDNSCLTPLKLDYSEVVFKLKMDRKYIPTNKQTNVEIIIGMSIIIIFEEL